MEIGVWGRFCGQGMLSGSRYYVVARFGTFAHKTCFWPKQANPVGHSGVRCVPGARLWQLLIHLEYYNSITISLGCGRWSTNCCSLYTSTLSLSSSVVGRRRSEKMADDATRTSTTSLEDDDDQRYLDDAAWARREEGYRQQIKALEEQHKTLKNAWSDIVRTNLLKVDELKRELETRRAKRDSVRDALAAARSTGAATHDRLVAELCSAKVEVAELNERRDRARKKLGEEARTLVGL